MQCVGSGDVKTVGFGFNIYLISWSYNLVWTCVRKF
jgi:hypothetical protein